MINVPSALQLQLSEAVTLIADNDFPDQWQSLIQVHYVDIFNILLGFNQQIVSSEFGCKYRCLANCTFNF